MREASDAAAATGPSMDAVVVDIARRAGDIALRHFSSLATLPVERKGHLDLVTAADWEVEQYLVGSLHAAFPDDGIFGEEGGNIGSRSGRIWVIDPIDGTFNFVRGGQNWSVSIGLYDQRGPVFGVLYAPVRDLLLVGGDGVDARLNGQRMSRPPAFDLSRASMGIGLHPTVPTTDRLEVLRFVSDDLRINFRCCGAATLSLIEVATGETDGYLALGDASWDVMAALPILRGLGISHTIDWGRTGLDSKLRFACGSEAFLERVRPLLDRLGAELG